MMPPADQTRLAHMLRHAEEAIQFAAGRSRTDLDSDRLLNLALVRLLEIVGEAASRVSPAIQTANPAVPWPQIIGMRNRLVHGYDSVDFDILWDIVQVDLPPLITELLAILAGPAGSP
jgi:uncharacterized protein with HEPN domain